MKKNKRILTVFASAAIMVLLIVDTETAKNGVSEGLTLCMKVIIPSLFPFFVTTTYLNSAMLGLHIPGFQAIARGLNIPSGCESILLLGLIGGYPVGAQLIADAYRQDQLDRRTAQILLGYCSNAGPAFIFGITPVLFTSTWTPLLLWVIHLFSAILTGFYLPRPPIAKPVTMKQTSLTLVQALKKSIMICASVCGWIIVFKIILAYLSSLQFISRSEALLMIISGILELSNGCLNLAEISSEPVRFIVCSAILAFGGVCVILQTASVTEELRLGLYIPGKIIQTSISLLLSLIFSHILFPVSAFSPAYSVILISVCILTLAVLKRHIEKSCGNPKMIHV